LATVSIIIPTRNRHEFLRRAITSVLEQTYQDFELIVVDDASNDNTSQIVAEFKDPRIGFVRHPHRKGGSAARNTGIANAKGRYLAFLDDDDEWLPEKLARQMAVLVAGPAELGCVYTGCVMVNRASGKIFNQYRPTKRGDLSHELLHENCVGSTSTMLLKRECLERVGGFDETLPSCQDYDLWIRIAQEFEFEVISEPLFKYYFQDRKISNNLDALNTGLEMLAKKYSKPPLSKKFYSSRHLSLGVLYCYAGNDQKAKKALWKAIKIHPLALRPYLYLGLAFFGQKNFKVVNDVKETLSVKFRRAYYKAF
jgi:glycosyltransferase involved in cell wall biosynthesis